MAYYIAVERTPGSYEAINIKNTTKGNSIFPNDKIYECTLEEIDKFTTEYENLSSLKYMLYSEKKIPHVNSALSIVYANESQLEISKDILFKESRVYLESPDLAVAYLSNKFLGFDLDFCQELALNLSDKNPTRTMLETLSKDIQECISYNLHLDVTSTVRIAKSLIYNLDSDGLIINQQATNYTKLHNILAFIAKYENKRKKEKTKTKTKNT